MPKLANDELLSIIHAHRANSLGSEDSDLANERSDALDHYHGRPYGDEQTGRSAVVSQDLKETVGWVMPSLMRIFTQSGSLAEFAPVGPEDEARAEQETDYTNYVIMRDNPGFLVIHDAVWETLVLKNGYVKHWWDESEKVREVEYEGLSIEELMLLEQRLSSEGADVEVIEQEETLTEFGPLFDVKLRIKHKTGKVRLEAVPVEEIRVSKRCRGSLQDSPFVEHVTTKTRSELIEMGMKRAFVDELPAVDQEDNDSIVLSRDSVSDESDSADGTSVDRSMDEIEYTEAYVRVDYDDDGIAELRCIVTVADKIPPGKEWNEPIDSVPITGFVAKRIPHRHVGESLDDELADLQRVKTVLTRQLLDNIYLTNNQQWLVNDRVNIKDFLQSLPGGVKRVSGEGDVTGSAVPVTVQPILQQILPAIDYIDGVKANRTGIDKGSTQVDPNLLKETTKGAYMEALRIASQKVEMMARLLAELGIKELVHRVHELLMKHQDKARIVKLRGDYVPVNPTEWRERTDLVVKVGLGTGTEEEKREKLMLMASLVQQIAALGLVGPKQAYALFADIAKTLGEQNPEKYAMDPASPEYQQIQQQKSQQGQPNPLAEAEQVKGQYQMQAKQMESQLKMQIAQMQEQHKHEMDTLKSRFDAMNKDADRRSREAIEAAKLEVQAFIAGTKIDIGQPGIGAGLQE